MKKVLIFAGTTEGRRLAELLAKAKVSCKVCVATEYGTQLMKEQEGQEILQGRLSEEEMEALMGNQEFLAVVDATHPFATLVSKNIRESAAKAGLRYLRLQRNTGNTESTGQGKSDKIRFFADSAECAKALEETEGNILLTTGSKELTAFCQDKSVKERLFVRVLPGVESIEKCREAEISGKQILALQGPFSEDLNRALIKEYQIKHLVTKETGVTGGYPQKVAAAIKEDVNLYIIGNPETAPGLSFEEVCAELEVLTGKHLAGRKKMVISLIGTGMGNAATLTKEAEEALKQAHYIFGAKRLLSMAAPEQTTYPCYLAKDILPVLEELLEKKEAFGENSGELRVGILFSGDSGFYSGCEKMYRELCSWKEKKEAEGAERKEEAGARISISIYPGISALSYFSASCGVSWQDAKILSLHGRSQDNSWRGEVKEAVRTNGKTFLLLSGVEDLRNIGKLLTESGLEHCKVLTGYQLSYPEEEILCLTPKECMEREKEGLYVCLITNETPEKRMLTHGKKDEEFLRDKVPMTKEEIREAAICKLGLYEGAVVYDIGSGTGSIAVEIADRSPKVQVYALEQKEAAVELIKANREKFHLENLEILHTKAPEGLEELPPATHAFIGGSSGNLRTILEVLQRINPAMRIVITAISLETVSEITTLLNDFSIEGEEIVQMQVSRSKKAGAYHLMQAENPVYVCSFRFG